MGESSSLCNIYYIRAFKDVNRINLIRLMYFDSDNQLYLEA